MMRRGDHGDAVQQVQRKLLALGYTLPRWHDDGWLGSETLEAFGLFLADHKSRDVHEIYGPVVSDNDLALLDKIYTAVAFSPGRVPKMDLVDFYDRRADSSRAKVYAKRAWNTVTGICLHQTACNLGERPARMDAIGAHVVVTRAGKLIWLHDWTDVVIHGNGWNQRCVGIEMDGLYAGVKDDPKTVWDDPTTPQREVGMTPTPQLIETAKACVRWIVEAVAQRGGQVKYLVSHRQSSMDRRNDPGEELWKAVALPLHAELGLTEGGVDFTVGGYRIPRQWDPKATADY